MNLLNRLAEAKRRACFEGVILYVSDKGRIRKALYDWEEEVYKVEFKEGVQYVYEYKEQIQPKKKAAKRKPSKKTISKLSDAPDGEADKDI